MKRAVSNKRLCAHILYMLTKCLHMMRKKKIAFIRMTFFFFQYIYVQTCFWFLFHLTRPLTSIARYGSPKVAGAFVYLLGLLFWGGSGFVFVVFFAFFFFFSRSTPYVLYTSVSVSLLLCVCVLLFFYFACRWDRTHHGGGCVWGTICSWGGRVSVSTALTTGSARGWEPGALYV